MDIAQVIKYEGPNDVFVWKHPIEDFNTGTQLIVHESQEAIFFMNGQALDLFGAGRYTLESQNMPLIGKFFNRVTGDQTPFHCEVYFINKTEQMAIKWGTDSKVEYIEPTYNFPIQIGASGEMNLRAEDSRKLLVKIVGTENGLTQQGLAIRFRAFLMTRLKTYLATLIREQSINIFQIDQHLTEISEHMQTKLSPDFSGYGVALERFFVTVIIKPEEDRSYQKFKELYFRQYADVADAKIRQQVGVIEQQTQAQRMIIEAQGLAQKRSLEGFTYQDERGFDVAERVASNEAVGQMTNLGVGLGVMAGVGGTVGGVVGGMMQNTMGNVLKPQTSPIQGQPTACPKCGKSLPMNAKFCLECGEKLEVPGDSEILCPTCGVKTHKGKFCMGCGGPLNSVCPGCGKEVPPGGKFCLECGQKL